MNDSADGALPYFWFLPLPAYSPDLSVISWSALQRKDNFGTFKYQAWSPSPLPVRVKDWWCFSCVGMEALHTWLLALMQAGPHSNLFFLPAFPHCNSFWYRWLSHDCKLNAMELGRRLKRFYYNCCTLTKIVHLLILQPGDHIHALSCTR